MSGISTILHLSLMSPLVSVIIPAYNAEQFIGTTIPIRQAYLERVSRTPKRQHPA